MQNKKTIFSSVSLIFILCFLFLFPSLVQSQAETVTLTVGNDLAPSGSQGNQIAISLDNDVPVGVFQLDICDEDDFISFIRCEGVNRALGVGCFIAQKYRDRCHRIMVISRQSIAPGSGSVLNIEYAVSEEAPEGQCRGLNPQNEFVVDVDGYPLEVTLKPGLVCFIKDDWCPVKTIYGENSVETGLLRSIRDNVLSKTHEDRELIKLYYQWSPAIVKVMETDEEFKGDVKELVDGVLWMVE